LVDRQRVRAELRIGEVDAQERQMVGVGLRRGHRGRRRDDQRRQRRQGRLMLGPHPPERRLRVVRGPLGQRQQQAALGPEPLHQRARHQSDLGRDGRQGQARRPHASDHVDRGPQDHRVVDPSRASRRHQPSINKCTFIY
jgi:hypothetical protein